MVKNVVGFFDDLTEVEPLVKDLRALGLSEQQISLIAHDPKPDTGPKFRGLTTQGPQSVKEGSIVGGAAGFLAGIAALAVPGVGPVILAGPLFAGLIGAGIVAGGGALVGAFRESGMPNSEAEEFSENLKRGGSVVLAAAPEDKVDAVIKAMESHGAVDIGEGDSGAKQQSLRRARNAPSGLQRRRPVRTYVRVR